MNTNKQLIQTLDQLDLDINNYTLSQLLNLFSLNNSQLTEEDMKNAKKLVHKIHPDKSRLDEKFFLFYVQAYKRVEYMYNYQQKNSRNQSTTYEPKVSFNTHDVDINSKEAANLIQKKLETFHFENGRSNEFNNWFNKTYEKYKQHDPESEGYSEWLKSNDNFISVDHIKSNNINDNFRQIKQEQRLINYNGQINDYYSSGSLAVGELGGASNFTSSNYTDLKQAYTETLLGVDENLYNTMPKYQNVNEYNSFRDRQDITPLSKAESERILQQSNNNLQEQNAMLSYKYAQEYEQAKKFNQNVLGDLRYLK